jgi:opacity protein-like surface antigen
MRTVVRAGFLLALLAALPTSAQAQLIGQALGGMTSAADRQIFLGGSLGVRAGFVQFDVEVGRMRDVLPEGVLSAVRDFQEENDFPVDIIPRLTNTYVVGNVRLISPAGPVRPFVGAGAGLAHLEPKFEVTTAGINLGDVFGEFVDPVNKPMFQFGGGLSFDLGERSSLELGYRYVIVDTEYTPLDLITGFRVRAHVFYAGFGARF